MKFILTASQIDTVLSHLTRGAWIEISRNALPEDLKDSRTSHEVRGLKYSHGGKNTYPQRSHLTRGAWIEILETIKFAVDHLSRTSHEVRGLKFCSNTERISCIVTSHLTRGAWIEITGDRNHYSSKGGRTSHEVRGLKL